MGHVQRSIVGNRRGPSLRQIYRLREELHGQGLEAARHDTSDPELHELRLDLLSAMDARYAVLDELLTGLDAAPGVLGRIEFLRARLRALEDRGPDGPA
jgi:hypothetical protein